VTATVPVGHLPSAVAVNPATNTIYVANQEDGTVTVINGGAVATATVIVGMVPVAIAVNSATNQIYVASVTAQTDGTVAVINGVSNATATVNVGMDPIAIAVNSVTNQIYVANSGVDNAPGNSVTVIDGVTNAATAVTVGTQPTVVAVNSVTNQIYVANKVSNTVTVIDGITNATTTVAVGAELDGIAVNSVTNKIYVTNAESGNVTVIDGVTNATTTVTVGSEPGGIAVNSVTNQIYVANQESNTVTVIDGATNATTTLAVGTQPVGIAVNSVTNQIYVVNVQSNTVTVIEGATNEADTVSVGIYPEAIAVNSATNTAYVAAAGYTPTDLTFVLGDVTVIAGTGGTPTPIANAPAFAAQPISVSVTGGRVALAVVATNSPSYQWWLNGTTMVAGATDPILVIADAASGVGSYTCVATNSQGSATSNPATVATMSTSNPGRLTNLSCRAQVGTGADIMTAGFVIGGAGTSGSQSVLVRGTGPTLSLFGLTGLLADPKLTLNNTSGSANEVVATNTGWGGNASIASEAAALGAFSWGTAATPDSALLVTLPADNYTAQISGASGDTGLALVEVYDATTAGTYTVSTPRLVNLSALVQVGSGANVVFAGFVVGGNSAKTVLIRASGPALAAVPFSFSGTLPDPQLTLTNTSVSPNKVVTVNTGWNGDPEINSVAGSVGAFQWSLTGADSAILITLPPGNYTAGVAGASNDTGLSLLELYEVD